MGDGERLLRAAERGEVEEVERLLALGVTPDPAAPGEDSPLCLASMFGHLEVARRLLERGARVSHRGAYGRSPLHYAAQASLPLTRLMLEHGADPNARNDGDEDALADLITRPDADPEVARLLIARGTTLRVERLGHGTHLMWAAFCGRVEIAEALLDAGADPSVEVGGDSAFGQLVSCSDAAARRAILPAMVRKGLSGDARASHTGETVLMAACGQGDLELVRSLLDRGADPNASARFGMTALTRAAEGGNPAVTELLLARGATPSAVTRATPPRLVEAEALASSRPDDGSIRLAYARALLEEGYEGAAWLELCAADRLGAAVPPALRERFSFEKPEGVRWTYLPPDVPPEGVTAPRDDSRVPRVMLQSGERTLPLAILLGAFCTACDERGETVCSDCGGSGVRSGFFNADHEYSCEPRQTCSTCGGTKYQLNSFHAGKGACRHPSFEREASGPGYELSRCPRCGLPAVSCGWLFRDARACGACGRLDCICERR